MYLTTIIENKNITFLIIKEKGSVRYYGKPGWEKLIRRAFY